MYLTTEVQRAMRAAMPTGEGLVADYYGMIEYHLGWRDVQFKPVAAHPGKLLRPRLLLSVCALCGGRRDHALTAAAAVQLLHDFTLLHDDIQDCGEFRRGRPTVWHLWGSAQAINAGDSLCTIARQALLSLAEQGIAPARVLDAVRLLDRTTLTIIEGQYLDLASEGDPRTSLGRYLAMIGRKTAALFGASAALGALVAEAPAALIGACREFGEALGMAFQIQDDVLGIWGASAQTGKPRAADLARHKMTLPVIYALGHEAAEPVRRHYALRATSADLEPLVAVLDACGARQVAFEALHTWWQRSKVALAVLAGELPAADPGPLYELAAEMLPLCAPARQGERTALKGGSGYDPRTDL